MLDLTAYSGQRTPADIAERWVRVLAPVSYFLAIPLLHAAAPLAPLALAAALPLGLLAAASMPRPATSGNAIGHSAVIAVIAADLGVIIWGTLVSPGLAGAEIAVLALVIGLGSGIFGMLAAHEMIHSRDRRERAIGMLMLTGMTYRHFRISHTTGHHRWAATPRDPATAPRGESAYHFLVRSVAGQAADVWRLERRRGWRNRLLRDLIVYAAIYGIAALALGWRAPVFLALQGIVSIIVLELFNYVAHYGLIRETARGAPLAHDLSWNAGQGLDNWLLLNMGHHSDHHRRPSQDYGLLRPISDTPMLPGGYAGAILLSLAPPLWRRVMDPRVDAVLDR